MTDALTDILKSVHMEGSVFSRASLDAPWGVESGDMPTGIFHAVVRGHAWVRLEDAEESTELVQGDIVLLPFGDNHLITDMPTRPTRPIVDLTTTDAQGMGHLVVNGGGEHTSLVCGAVQFDHAIAHPVFSLLPRLIHVRDPDGSMLKVVETLVHLIADEVDQAKPGAETVVARLTDALVVYMLRNYIDQSSPGESGWIGSLRDPGIREALGLIHRNPERNWTARELAHASGMSRSVFFERFRRLVGETPNEYLTKWRVHVACRLLREQGHTVASAAHHVGYSTESAFSNAFVRLMDIRPGAYRKNARLSGNSPPSSHDYASAGTQSR